MNSSVLSTATTVLLVALSALVLLKESRQGRVPLAFGLLLLGLVEICDVLALRAGGPAVEYLRFDILFKSLIPAAFLLYGILFTRQKTGVSRAMAVGPLLALAAIFSAAALIIPMEQFYVDFDLRTGRMLVLSGVGYWFYLGLMIFCIAALVSLESVFAAIRGGIAGGSSTSSSVSARFWR